MNWRSKLRGQWILWTSLFWTFAPRGILRFLPGSSLRFGPPRRYISWRKYRARYPVDWRVVYESRSETLPPPFFCNDPEYPWQEVQQVTWPEFGVAEIPEARLLDEHGWVVGRDDQHIQDFDYFTSLRSLTLNQMITLPSPRRLEGRTLNLSSAFGCYNFYHYLIDGLSRMHLVEKAGYSWDHFDHIILSRFNTPLTAAMEKAFGIPTGKIIRLARHDHVECDLLVQPSYPGWTAQTPWWVPEYLRKILPTSTRSTRKKIYLPRSGPRNPTLLTRIEEQLEDLGFERADVMNEADLFNKLAAASHIVSSHGAALTNIFLCQPGTRVLELFPSDIAHAPRPYYYYTLAHACGFAYGAIVGRATEARRFKFDAQSQSPFEIKWKDFEAGMTRLLAT